MLHRVGYLSSKSQQRKTNYCNQKSSFLCMQPLHLHHSMQWSIYITTNIFVGELHFNSINKICNNLVYYVCRMLQEENGLVDSVLKFKAHSPWFETGQGLISGGQSGLVVCWNSRLTVPGSKLDMGYLHYSIHNSCYEPSPKIAPNL